LTRQTKRAIYTFYRNPMTKPRIIKIKAWNIADGHIKRISKIDCVKSELFKNGHILFQYTGMKDQHKVEIYDGDMLLYQHNKHVVSWDEEEHQWIWTKVEDNSISKFNNALANASMLLCHSLESNENSSSS